MSVVQDFKEFAIKGNAVDMAVGILIGVAFNKIVQSLVNDIFMPPLGLIIGGVEFKDLRLVLKDAAVGDTGEAIPEVALRYGQFINTCIEFLIIAFAAFVAVRVMNALMRGRENEAEVG